VISTPPAHRRRGGIRWGRLALLVLATIALVGQGALIAGGAWAATNSRFVADRVTALTIEIDPVVLEYARQAALTEEAVLLLRASQTQVVPAGEFDTFCTSREAGIGVLGCYRHGEGRIYLYDVVYDDLAPIEPVVAAHEMLHAAWDRMSAAEHDALAPLLEESFAALESDHELVERIAAYEAADPRSRIPELYAIVGTELTDIPEALERHYARWFVDRSASTALTARVSAVFADFQARLLALRDELTELSERIASEQSTYDADAAVLQADIAVFNVRAQQPGGYTSRSEFESDRDALVARQNALTDRLEATNSLIAQHNELLIELEALNAEADTLNRSINVTLTPIEQRDGDDGASPEG
jgi:hypothetical protein